MLLELPEKFCDYNCEIKEGVLIVSNNIRFEDLMYPITYKLRGTKCIYCGEKMDTQRRTLDHRYPRDMGGISITNNLFPTCISCNVKKRDLTHEEFLIYKNITNKKERKKYLRSIQESNEELRKKIGYKLPIEWITYININEIKSKSFKYYIKGKKYYKLLEYYQIYNNIKYPIIIDKNNKILDVSNCFFVCKKIGIKNMSQLLN